MQPATFADLNLANSIRRALEAENYTTPTPIQARSIPPLLEGRDLLGSAQTGTGKTAAFALPILNRFETRRRPAAPYEPRALVLSPTRELAAQIGKSFSTYGQYVKYRQTIVYGGVNQNFQVRSMKRGAHLVVATPGRLLDLMNQGCIRLGNLEMFVLDEADRMLDMGFLPDLKRIIASLPENRQSLFFSATLSKQITELASSLLRNPERVILSPQSLTVDRIIQRVLFVQQSDKQTLLHHVMRKFGIGRTLIFTRTRRGADRVARQLSRDGFRADAIHGQKSQNFRTRALEGFRRGQLSALVATDVAARGIDVDGITHVINYDMPVEPESYVHRIGRTGRAGADGTALSFCDSSERSSLRAIERLIRSSIRIESDHPFDTKPAPASKARRGDKPTAKGDDPRAKKWVRKKKSPKARAGRKFSRRG